MKISDEALLAFFQSHPSFCDKLASIVRHLFDCAVRAGFGADSRVHAVGDGAPWIVGQIEDLFGEQGSYFD